MRHRDVGLARRYRRAVEEGDVGMLAELYHPDALLDLHVLNWWLQVVGGSAAAEQTSVMPRPGRFAAFDPQASAGGVLVQFEWHQDADAGDAVVRQLHVWSLAGERIAEHVVFCAGVWGPDLRARMAAEAPLVRP